MSFPSADAPTCIYLAQLAGVDGAFAEAAAERRDVLLRANEFASTAFAAVCLAGIAGLLVARSSGGCGTVARP